MSTPFSWTRSREYFQIFKRLEKSKRSRQFHETRDLHGMWNSVSKNKVLMTYGCFFFFFFFWDNGWGEVAASEAVWFANPEIFTVWSFTGTCGPWEGNGSVTGRARRQRSWAERVLHQNRGKEGRAPIFRPKKQCFFISSVLRSPFSHISTSLVWLTIHASSQLSAWWFFFLGGT